MSNFLLVEIEREAQEITLFNLLKRLLRTREIHLSKGRISSVHRLPSARPLNFSERVLVVSRRQVCVRRVWIERPSERSPVVEGQLRHKEVGIVSEGEGELTQVPEYIVELSGMALEVR